MFTQYELQCQESTINLFFLISLSGHNIIYYESSATHQDRALTPKSKKIPSHLLVTSPQNNRIRLHVVAHPPLLTQHPVTSAKTIDPH